MENVPFYISLVFILITIVAVFIFWSAAERSSTFLLAIAVWLAVQAFVSRQGFYLKTAAMPPHFMLAILPPFIMIVILFITKRGRLFIDSLSIKRLLLLHSLRIFVETVLLLLYIHKVVPQIMTFEGRNLDILSGISALIIFFLFKKANNRLFLLIWNFAGLALLINIVVIAILSAPFPFQQFGFDQPNIAILNFPFVWLPSVVVPLVLLSHLAAIRQLIVKNKIEVL